jgi:hypothetical protein
MIECFSNEDKWRQMETNVLRTEDQHAETSAMPGMTADLILSTEYEVKK